MQPIRQEQFIAGIVIGCLIIALLFSISIFYFAWSCHEQDKAKLETLLPINKPKLNKSKLTQLLVYAMPIS